MYVNYFFIHFVILISKNNYLKLVITKPEGIYKVNKAFKILFLMLILLNTNVVRLNAQKYIINDYPYYIKAMYVSGHIAEHSKDVSNMSRGFTNGVDLMFNNLIRIHSELKDRNPDAFLDLGLHYVKYPHNYLGESYAVTFGKSGRILKYGKLQLFGQYTQGIGYGTKPFSIDNNKNMGYSTGIGFVAHADINATYPIYKNWEIMAGVGFNHLSNGGMKRPNLGINVFSTNIGVVYQAKSKTIEIPEDIEYSTRKYFYHLIGTYFRTSNLSFDGITYPAFNFHAQVERNISLHHSLLLSADYSRDMKEQYPDQKDPKDTNSNEYDFFGISAGGNWKYSLVDMDLTVGAYILKPWHQNSRQYSLIHFKVYAIKHTYLLVGLKAHGFQADVFEVGIGIKL